VVSYHLVQGQGEVFVVGCFLGVGPGAFHAGVVVGVGPVVETTNTGAVTGYRVVGHWGSSFQFDVGRFFTLIHSVGLSPRSTQVRSPQALQIQTCSGGSGVSSSMPLVPIINVSSVMMCPPMLSYRGLRSVDSNSSSVVSFQDVNGLGLFYDMVPPERDTGKRNPICVLEYIFYAVGIYNPLHRCYQI